MKKFSRNLINGHRVLSSNDPMTGPFPLSWAKEFLGRPSLKRVSVGEFGQDGAWVEERIDYVWVSHELALGFCLPAITPRTVAQPYHSVRNELGYDCYLSEEVDGVFWLSKADGGIRVPADLSRESDEALQYSDARKLIGPCSLGYNNENQLCWISLTASSIYVPAKMPDFSQREKCWGV